MLLALFLLLICASYSMTLQKEKNAEKSVKSIKLIIKSGGNNHFGVEFSYLAFL